MCTTQKAIKKNDTCKQGSTNCETFTLKTLRFWEINHSFICPVVGMCLTLAEQKQVLKKSGFSIKNKDAFGIHEILVSSSESENRLSKKVDNLLNRKYKKEVESLLKLSPEEFHAHFKSAFRDGDCRGVLWTSAIHPQLPLEIRKNIFGDIHMSMHWSGEQSIKLKQMIALKQKELDDLQKHNHDLTEFRRSLQKDNKRINKENLQLKASFSILEKKNRVLRTVLANLLNQNNPSGVQQENERLKEILDDVMLEAEQKQNQIVKLKESNRHLATELNRQRESNKHFRQETQNIIGDFLEQNRCDATCPSFDLCQKRVLIVGGITRMESLYRELIEGSGGIFEYHDGYMKKGIKGLEGRLKRADVVVCPVNCNSHAACSIVKNLAKKHNKTVHMLASSSLNAVTQAIWNPSEQGTIN